MKKAIIVLAISLAAFCSFAPEQKLHVELSQGDWVKHLNKLEVVKQIADESNLPHQQVEFIKKSIDSLEMVVVPQLQTQIKDTTKKK